jgi:hypothetical protein
VQAAGQGQWRGLQQRSSVLQALPIIAAGGSSTGGLGACLAPQRAADVSGGGGSRSISLGRGISDRLLLLCQWGGRPGGSSRGSDRQGDPEHHPDQVVLVAVGSQVQDAPGCGAGVEGSSQARPAAGGEAGPAGGSRDSACQPAPPAEHVEEEGSHLVG